MEDIRHGQSLIRLRLYGWRNADLECDKIFEEGMKELEYWTFTSSDIEVRKIRVKYLIHFLQIPTKCFNLS